MIRKIITRRRRYRDRETDKELVGLLTAISIVSRRLAHRLSSPEQQLPHEGGDSRYATRTRPAD